MPSPDQENSRYHNHDPELMDLDRVAISVKSHRLLHQLLSENPKLERIMRYAKTEIEALIGIRTWVVEVLANNERAVAYYRGELAQENQQRIPERAFLKLIGTVLGEPFRGRVAAEPALRRSQLGHGF